MRRALLIAVGILLMGATVIGTLSRNQGFFSTIQVGSGSTISSLATGPACTIAVGTTCTVTTVGGTSASLCFFSQISGTAVACTCASGTNSVIITCPAATSGVFNGLLVN